MQRFVYKALRVWPVRAVLFAIGSISFAATVFGNKVGDWIVSHADKIDYQKTGFLGLILFSGWLCALWTTRHWGQSDRDYYKGELQHPYSEHQNLYAAFRNLTDDNQLPPLVAHAGQRMEATANFINDEIGSAAFSKYASGHTKAEPIAWEGYHRIEAQQTRAAWMTLLSLRLSNLEQLLGSGAWDDPRPVHGRLALRDGQNGRKLRGKKYRKFAL